MQSILALILLLGMNTVTSLDEPTYAFDPDKPDLATAMRTLAGRVLDGYEDEDRETDLDNRFRLQIVAQDYAGAVQSVESLRRIRKERDEGQAEVAYVQYEIFARAKLRQSAKAVPFEKAFRREFRRAFRRLDDMAAFEVAGRLVYNLNLGRRQLQTTLEQHRGSRQVGLADAISLVRRYMPLRVYESILPLVEETLAADDRKRYAIKDDVLVKAEDGGTLSAVVVRPRRAARRLPAALVFIIYSDPEGNVYIAKQAAAHGYVGVVADARGKRLSPDEILPYEHEVTDTHAVIDWISRQPWSNGAVGMYGGSYSGFAQWAATKRLHPALKTIVPSAAAIPGLGLPMYNNVFINANYCWAFYVGSHKLLDQEVCRDRDRWDSMVDKWYASGRPYREIDQVDGTPNPLLQRWLTHPSYDEYWQKMVPFRTDYAKIDIPVLSITGYYDDGQISALHYLREHYKHNRKAEHYLIIGPYDHWGAQWRPAPVLRGYEIDPSAHIDVAEITFQWLDHVLRGGDKPSLLENKINFQLMGADRWRHVGSLAEASEESLTLYLSNVEAGDHYRLSESRPSQPGSLRQEVDFADRKTTRNDEFYPDPIIRTSLETGEGLVFVSEPFSEPVEINGAFSGLLKATINKADMDVGVTLYELTPDGRYFHLSYYLGRASYAKDMTTRQLLRPGAVESIPIQRTQMVARRLESGSRLVALLDVNKNPGAQVNHGTGRDVSDESVADAETPLRVEWHNDSHLEIPLSRLTP